MNNQPVLTRRYSVHEAIAVREIEGQILLLTPNDDVLYTLNKTGHFIWELLVKGMVVAQMVETLVSEYHISREKATNDLLNLLQQLEEKAIIQVEE